MNSEYGSKKKKQSKSLTALVLFIIFLLTSVGITQFLAEEFNYHKALTGKIYTHIYQPFAWISWHFEYYSKFEDIFLDVYGKVLFVVSVFAMIYITIFLLMQRKEKKHSDVHGTAHWATHEEIEAEHLLNRKDGVYIGGWEDEKGKIQYLRHNGPEHVLGFAPTRSGKGVGLVIPTLLSWADSCIVLDIKGENHAITANWREKYANNKIYMFNPNDTTGAGHKFNALCEVRLGTPFEISDIENIVIMLLDEDGEGLKDFWEKGGKIFLSSFILHVLYVAEKELAPTPSLTTIYKELNSKSIEEILADMSSYYHLPDEETHIAVATGARGLINLAERTRGDILQTINNALSLYIDPVIENNIQSSDFKLDDLMNGDKPVTLYIVIDPDNIDRMKPMFRILMLQILKKLIKKLEFNDGENVKAYKHKMLLMFDEFPSVGKIDFIEQSIAFMAGYGVLFYGIIQDIEQLHKHYGDDETIISNCHIRIAYTPNKEATADLISKMCGTTTVVKSYITTSGKRLSPVLSSVSQSFQEVSRPLLTVDEVLRLPMAKKDASGNILEPGNMLIFVAGKAPIMGTQILFFKDKVFLDRSKV